MSIHALTERAMVLTLAISRWQGQRLDREASREVTESKGADADAARVNKHLVPKETLAAIISAANVVRDHFYSNTLPWRDNGGRLLTRKLYMPFIEKHQQLVHEFDAAVRDFLDNKYPVAIEKAAFRMGDLFDPNDYPTAAQLQHRFRIGLDIEAIATANDFRVQIDADHVEKVKQQIEEAAMRRVQNAQADVWKRLLEKVSYFADRLGNPDAVFRDSTVSNVDELVDLIPGLNVLDDPDIEAIRLQVKAKLAGHDAKDIRKDPAMREELAGEAKAIVDKMAGFMRAFGTEVP